MTPSQQELSRTERIRALAEKAKDRAEQLRGRVEKVPTGAETLDAIDHDRRIAGSLLAGALAYRLFLWLLPLALVAVSALGFLRAARTGAPADYAEDFGVSAYITSSVADASEHAQKSRWAALIIGLVALASTSYTVARTTRAIFALAWAVPMGRLRSAGKSAIGVVGIALLVVAISTLTRAARDVSFVLGVVATVVSVLGFGGLLYLVAWLMPHRQATLLELLPGPVVSGVGIVGLQATTVYYIVPRLQSAGDTYGALGSATVVLLWLYLAGRLIVLSAVVNANHWARRHDVDLDAERPGLVSRSL